MCSNQPDSFKTLVYTCKNNNNIAYRTKAESVSYNTFFYDVISAQKNILHKIPNANIVLSAKPSYEWIVLFFAIQLAGKTAILIDNETSPDTLSEFCTKYNSPTIINGFNRTNNTVFFSHQKHIYNTRNFNISTHKQDDTHISTVIFTSGTSNSKPKGVALSETGLLASAFYGYRASNITNTDTLLHVLPFHHAFGLVAEVIAPLMSKTILCFGDTLATIVNDINHYKATAIYAVPQIIQGLLFYIKREKLPTLKKITNGSAPLDAKSVNLILNYGLEIHVSYGLSEFSPCVAISRPIESFDEYYSGDILPCCTITISSENEICICGTNIMIGYYDGKHIDTSNIRNGIFYTGDTGFLKNDKLYVTGRIKDILVFNNGKKYNKSFFEKKLIEITAAKECYVFTNDDTLNIILCNPKKMFDIKTITEILPKGIKLGNIYEKNGELKKTKLNKVINSPNLQIQNCRKLSFTNP